MKKKFIKYVSFNILSNIGMSCYILADTLFIANGVGLDGLTALNIVLPVYNLIFAVGLLLGIGGATEFSILRAQKNNKEASLYYTHAIIIGLLFSVFIMIPGFTNAKEIVTLLGADNDIISIAVTYLKSFILFTPFFILQQIIVTFVRNDDNPKLASIAMLTGTTFNIILDYIFVFPMNLGMMGAALATGCSPIIALSICSLHFIQKKNNFHFIKNRLSFRYLKQIFKIGLPSFITELSSGIIIYAFNLIILSISGNIAVASYGILSNLAIVVAGLYNGISQGIQPLLSQSFGLKLKKEVKAYLKMAIITSLIISIFVLLSTILYPYTIVSWFNSENSQLMTDIAVHALPIYFFAFFFIGINMILVSYFSSITLVKPSSIISILRSGIILIPLVVIFAKVYGLIGVWISYPVSECIIMFLGLLLLKMD